MALGGTFFTVGIGLKINCSSISDLQGATVHLLALIFPLKAASEVYAGTDAQSVAAIRTQLK